MAAAAATLLLAASCQQEELNPTVPGREISFNVSTIYSNGIATRTEYSDENIEVNGRNYERINWVIGDPITVYSPEASVSTGSHYANYKVKAVSTSGASSIATVTSEYPFYWGDGVNNFVALYPSPGTDGTDSGLSMEGSQITAVIPANQSDVSMKYAYMYSTSAARESDTSVSLEFHPLINAFHFSFYGDAQTGAVLKSLSLSSASNTLAGAFSVDVDSSDWSLASSEVDVKEADASKTISVSFGDNGVELPLAENGAQPFEYTIFAIPDQLTQLTLTLTFKKDGTESVKTLELKDGDEWITVPSGRKINIESNVPVPEEGWTYTLEDVDALLALERHDFTAGDNTNSKGIYSYKTKDGVKEAVEVSFRFSPADAQGNNLNQWSTTAPAWLTGLVMNAHTEDQNPEDAFTITGSFTELPQQTSVTLNEIEDHIASLKARGSNGATSSAPQDLCLYDIDNLSRPRSSGIKTANSYVVNKAGWYMFPLVYGNAIDNEVGVPSTGWNFNSFSRMNFTPDGSALTALRNYVNEDIKSPYILEDAGLTASGVEAVIVWEDVSGNNQFINSVSLIEDPPTSAVFKKQDGSVKAVPYIRFNVDAGNIREGNAVIALRERTGQKRIIWSWHIWISDAALNTVNVATRSTTISSNDLLTKPLGWCDDKVEVQHSFTPRKYFVEAAQVEGNAAPVVFAVTQYEDSYYTTSYTTMPHYQFGRKDPFLPIHIELFSTESNSQGGFVNPPYTEDPRNKEHSSPAGYTVAVADTALPFQFITDKKLDTSFGIQNPTVMYSGNETGWSSGQVMRNFWNMCEDNASAQPAQSDLFDQSKDRQVYKTVYDPCPPGFSIPNYSAFTIFTVDGNDSDDFANNWNLANYQGDFHAYGETFYTDESKSKTIFLYNTAGRRKYSQLEGMFYTAELNEMYYFTAKSSGTRYFVGLDKGMYWVQPGPVMSLSKQHAFAVLPAREQPSSNHDNVGGNSSSAGQQVDDYNLNNWQ